MPHWLSQWSETKRLLKIGHGGDVIFPEREDISKQRGQDHFRMDGGTFKLLAPGSAAESANTSVSV